MRTHYFFSLFVVLALVLTGCKNENKNSAENATESTEEVAKLLKADANSAKVEWTAFKTTEKTPVKGEVKSVEMSNFSEGSTPQEVLNNAKFKINLLDFSTEDPGRDETLTESFFTKLVNPDNVTGQFQNNGDDWSIAIKFNGVTVEKLPVEVKFEDNTAHVSTTLELEDFKALEALASLHEACFDLHTGADGESKTWEVVDINASVSFQEVE